MRTAVAASADGRDVVSVMIPAYNAATTIQDTLESVWRQHYRPIELVVVDDGSADETRGVVEQWAADKRSGTFATVLETQSNQGLLKTRSRGLGLSQGEFLQFLDADDLLHPEKFARCVPLLREGVADVVVARTDKFFEVDEVQPRLDEAPSERPWSDAELTGTTITSNYWHSVGPLLTRGIVEQVGDFPPDVHPFAEELEFHGRIKLATRKITYLDQVLSFYRKGRPDALTGTLAKVYQGRIESARVACELLQRHEVSDPREWSSLMRMCLRTYYQTLCCTEDRDTQDRAWNSMRDVARVCCSRLRVARIIPRPVFDSLFRSAHRLRGGFARS